MEFEGVSVWSGSWIQNSILIRIDESKKVILEEDNGKLLKVLQDL
jgi:hypothetical protein